MVDWWLTKDGDKSCLALYERHYSAYKYADGRKRTQFVGPGENIVLRTGVADALFVWRRYIDDTIPKQEGVECAVFRNEGGILSSELVRQADAIADVAWPGARHYTKVRASAVRSANAGYCFIRAGWRRAGHTKGGLLILERIPVIAPNSWLEEAAQFPEPSGSDGTSNQRKVLDRGVTQGPGVLQRHSRPPSGNTGRGGFHHD